MSKTAIFVSSPPVHSSHLERVRLALSDGRKTTMHIVRHERAKVRPKVVLFEREALLLDWCRKYKYSDAMTGGFFSRSGKQQLGDLWIKGEQKKSLPFREPWGKIRGSIYIDPFGALDLDFRNLLPKEPIGDLLQAGPLVVKNGESLAANDIEGFSSGADQFDDDITIGRFPRSGIGIDEKYIWCLAADGYSSRDAGLTMQEFANFFIKLGATEALNLDGGSSSSLIRKGVLINKPRSTIRPYPKGRGIYSALVFEYF